jgi:hypothetical protein
MCAESAQMLGFPACLFAIGAPVKQSGFFENALKHAIRERGNEDVAMAEQPDSRKTFDPAPLNAAPQCMMPCLIEGQSAVGAMQFGSEASQEVLLTAVDINTKPSPIVFGDVMHALAVQGGGRMESPIPAMDIANAGALPDGGEGAQWMFPVPAESVETVNGPQQPAPVGNGEVVAASIVSPVVVEKTASSGLLSEMAPPDDVHVSGDPAKEMLGDLVLKHKGATSRDLIGVPVKGMPPIRGEPPVEKMVVSPKGQVWAPEPDALSLVRDGPATSAPGNASSAGPEMATAAKGAMFVLNDFGSPKSHERVSGLMPEASPNIVFDGNALNVVPEHPTYSDARSVVEIGRGELFDQLVQGVRVAQNTGGTEVLVHLKPDFLGRLSIRAMTDDHGIRVEIRAENEVVRQVMQDNMADLQQRLADRDLNFSQLSILADTGWHSRREPHWPTQESPVWSDAEPESPLETAVESIPYVQSGTIDYFA